MMTCLEETSVDSLLWEQEPNNLVILALAHGAVLYPTRVAVQDENSALTYAELFQAVHSLASQLQPYRGQAVGIFMDNSISWMIADLAGAFAETIVVPLPLFFSAEQLLHTAHDAGLKMLLTLEGMPILALYQSAGLLNANPQAWHDASGQHKVGMYALSNPYPVAFPKNTAKVTYTSGTTGTPKGVCLSADTMAQVANSLATASWASLRDKHFCVLPLSTLLENIAGIYTPLLVGTSTTLLPLNKLGLTGSSTFQAQLLLAQLKQHQITTAVLTPELLYGLVMHQESSPTSLPDLRFIAVGGASVSPRLLKRAEALGLPVFEGYGLSECGSVVALNTLRHRKPGSVGKPLQHVRVNFAPDGEIIVHYPAMQGYLGGATQAAQSIYTGDIGHLDADGFLHITARKKNVFITSFGRNVAPEWVERELCLSPSIHQAAVFGEAKPWNTAVLVVDAQATDSAIDANLHEINQTLPDYAQVQHWIRASRPFTLANGLTTSNGRIKRAAIQATYETQLNALYGEV
ncbi:AMP-binding protein [Methylobacillus methanolivorans]|uniref:AMP-binding protein n=1 Tax=Methylobacillus methanolivorans TaxID=1848927 RepID=A0ABW8GLF0_9PROT